MKMPDLSFLLGGWNGGNKAETPAIFSLIRSPFVKWREGNKASPPTLCFPRFAGFTNSDLWFSEERGE